MLIPWVFLALIIIAFPQVFTILDSAGFKFLYMLQSFLFQNVYDPWKLTSDSFSYSSSLPCTCSCIVAVTLPSCDAISLYF